MHFYYTYIIVAFTCLVSIPAFSNRDMFYKLMFYPYNIKRNKEWFRFLSHGFVHADWMHLLVNMYVLFNFGTVVELYFERYFEGMGRLFFLLLYIGALVMSSFYSYEKNKNNSGYSAVGASGAVSAILFSFILFAPTARLGLIFIQIPGGVPAWILGLLYLVFSWYMAKKGNDNIGHDAHFWGAVFGLLFTALLKFELVYQFIDEIKMSI